MQLFKDNVAPHGFGYIISRDSCKARRLVWFMLVILGILYSAYHIYLCFIRYLKYPCTTKPVYKQSESTHFPHVTVCPNGVHSIQDVSSKYPDIPLDFIFHMYSGYQNMTKAKSDMSPKLRKRLDSISYRSFLNFTNYKLKVEFCRYKGMDCKPHWVGVSTQYGYCIHFQPSEFDDNLGVTTSQGKMSLVLEYNQKDAFAGHLQYFQGLTLFYASRNEMTLDKTRSISIPADQTPIVAFRQIHEKKLGEPYSVCVGNNTLAFFDHYTTGHCMSECLAKQVFYKCGCTPEYLQCIDSIFFPSECSLYQMSFCVNPYIRKEFDGDKCGCLPACDSNVPEASLVQYGKYNYGHTGAKKKISWIAIVAFLADTREIVNKEVADYDLNMLLSDIGGAAGLFLGISVGTIVGLIDCAILAGVKLIRRLFDCRFKQRVMKL